MKIYIFLLPLLLFAVPVEKFHVCTVASTRNYPTFFYLDQSTREMGITLETIGVGLPYGGNGAKCAYMKEYLTSLPDDHIVLFVDAYDVMIIQSKEEILKKFLDFNVPFVIAAEKACVVTPDLAQVFDETEPMPYINSGGYIGYVSFLKKWLEELDISETARSDQTEIIRHYSNHPEAYCLDTKGEIFLCLYELSPTDLEFCEEGFRYTETGTSPGVIHANGGSFPLLIPIYKRFIQNSHLN